MLLLPMFPAKGFGICAGYVTDAPEKRNRTCKLRAQESGNRLKIHCSCTSKKMCTKDSEVWMLERELGWLVFV